jgi:23S rRNA (pseudouridine1915-N3)-methyltransferase
MKIKFLWIGKAKQKEFQKLEALYTQRLKHYCKYSIRELKEIKSKNPQELKQQEGQLFLSQIDSSDHLILLDETGEQKKSRQLAQTLQNYMNRSQDIVFLIGGAHGVSQEVFDRSDTTLSLSQMTLTHDMARILLLEQVYRANTIIRGEKYHND